MMSRSHASLPLVFVLACCISGCQRATDITKDDLLERTSHWKEPKVAVWYYVGSKQHHDYFRYDDLGVSELYRVPSGQITVTTTFPYTSERAKWIVMPWGPAAKRSRSSNKTMQSTAGLPTASVSPAADLELVRLTKDVKNLGEQC